MMHHCIDFAISSSTTQLPTMLPRISMTNISRGSVDQAALFRLKHEERLTTTSSLAALASSFYCVATRSGPSAQ
jgi:hypothetical protein